MSKLRNLKIFPCKEESSFDDLCLALWRRILGDPNAQLNGRRGQRQHGVDIFGRRAQTLDWVGVQCKVRTGGAVSESEIRSDVEKAKNFNPRLSELIFATTTPRDEKLQALARTLTEENVQNGFFVVTVFSWDDIELELCEESNLDICHRFYGDFFINYERLGIAVSRIIRVSIGVGHTPDTSYELLLGRTPSPDAPGSFFGLDYWKGINFIANWGDRSLDTFPRHVHSSDLKQVIKSGRDAYIIAKWLTDAKSIDELIYGEDDDHVMLISEEEYQKYLDSLRK